MSDNELVGVFMGVDVLFDTEKYRDSRSPLRHYIDNRPKDMPLEFDTNWNWLMTVVEKIENTTLYYFMQNVSFSRHSCLINPHVEEVPNPFCNAAENKIDAVFKTVVQYIKWLNDSKYKNKYDN